MKPINKLLLLAIGNPARGDDGLGPCLIQELAKMGHESEHIFWVYQLAIEHAELFTRYKKIIIIDALKEGDQAFQFDIIRPGNAAKSDFSSHILLPSTVLKLTHQLYDAWPEAYLLGIRGHEFSLTENLSLAARKNLACGLHFICDYLTKSEV